MIGLWNMHDVMDDIKRNIKAMNGKLVQNLKE